MTRGTVEPAALHAAAGFAHVLPACYVESMRNRFLASLFLIATSFGCDGAFLGTKSCTEIGCVNGLGIDFVRSTWPAGVYEVRLTLDGSQTAQCSATLPFASTTSGGTCNAPDIQLGTSGQMLPTSQHALTGVHIGGLPKTVRVEIRRDGSLQLAQDVTPAYATSQPNGPGCEPTCTNGHLQLTLP